MMLVAMTVILSASSFTGVSTDIEPAGPACVAPPPSASQACRICMDKACSDFLTRLEGCGNDQVCKEGAQLAYDLDLILCSACNPVLVPLEVLVRVMPEGDRAWLVRELASF